MKKIFLLGILILFITGCTNIENSSLDDIVDNVLKSKVSTKNMNRNGYRYYLPIGLSIKESNGYNEVIKDNLYTYYLYVDIVSFNNNTSFSYNFNEDAYYSKKIENDDKNGYIEINKYGDDKYLVEVMYNYAKIEVVVYESDITKVMSYVMVILNSITYNKDVIKNSLEMEVYDWIEENFDIFEIVGSDNYIEFTEDEEIDKEIKDPDYID